jgi:hypothetical protein
MLRKILCALGWHDWDKWSDELSFLLTFYQVRTCQNCNLIQRHYTGS